MGKCFSKRKNIPVGTSYPTDTQTSDQNIPVGSSYLTDTQTYDQNIPVGSNYPADTQTYDEVCRNHLEDLPELPLDKITEYFSSADLVISKAFPQLAYLKPRFQDIQKITFSIDGPSGGHFAPEVFFGVPIEAPGLISVKVWFKWKDQGWGNRKGQIWLQLVRNREVIADCHSQYSCVAPHDWEDRDFEVKEHDVIKKALKGDVLEVMRNAGGGGGHSLSVENFKMRIIYKKDLEDDD